jgi:hypothetical protein
MEDGVLRIHPRSPDESKASAETRPMLMDKSLAASETN